MSAMLPEMDRQENKPNSFVDISVGGVKKRSTFWIEQVASWVSPDCANAPIFQKATYGIVGDLFDVVPKLTEEFKKALHQ